MPNVKNYVLLETITVGAAGASSVTFNNIPQTGYTDLCLKVSARCNSSAIFGQLMLEINSSGTITDRLIQGDGSAVNSYTNSVGELGPMVTGANATANTFGNAELYFPNYAGSANKSVSVDGVSETNATTIYQVLTAALRADTNPITSITLKVRDGSQVSKNFVQYSTFSLYGLAAVGTTPTIAPKAAGGDIIQTDGTYWYHAFITSGTFTPAKALSADILVVAGGGGGGASYNWGAGGGGAGGLVYLASQSLSTSSQTITVGGGGAFGANGSNSQFASLTAAVGGGYGGAANGANGGSGGGAAYAGTAGTATSGQGYAGGNNNGLGGAGGGGGAGAVGSNASASNDTGGAGGAGSNTYSSWASITGTGVSGYFAGGGGGGAYNTSSATAAGGSGGGGTGGGSGNGNGTAGTANTGGGAGGAIRLTNSPSGGSGIVIVRYAVTA